MLYTNRPGQSVEDALCGAIDRASSASLMTAYVGADGCQRLGVDTRGSEIPVQLIVGRALVDGLPRQTLDYLRWLDGRLTAGGGGIRAADPPFHSKAYCFEFPDGGRVAWVGSSNLSGNGLHHWIEANVEVTDDDLLQKIAVEADSAWTTGVPITDPSIPIFERPPPERKDRPQRREDVEDPVPVEPGGDGLPGLRITLLDPRTGEVQPRSGLNWSFGRGRPRDPNEALIALRAAQLDAAEPVFGSVRQGTKFTALTHDGRRIPMKLGGGTPGAAKNISSDGDETTLGRWILRQVLAHPEGDPVTREVLEQYGRTDIGFYELGTDPETGNALVLMDFRPDPASNG